MKSGYFSHPDQAVKDPSTISRERRKESSTESQKDNPGNDLNKLRNVLKLRGEERGGRERPG